VNRTSENQHLLRWRTGLILTTLSLIIILLALEIGLRLGMGDVFPPRFFEPHAQFGHFHVPGRSGWQRTNEYETFISINSKGLRDVERSYEKPDGTFRILMLGDSFVEGLQVGQDQTLPAQLETRLNQHSAVPVEVINAGVSRYGTDNALLFLDGEGLRYEPDLVIYTFYPNDVTDIVENCLFELVDGRLTHHPTIISFSDRLRLVLYDISYTYRFVLGLSARITEAADETLIDTEWGQVSPIYLAQPRPEDDYAWESVAHILERMHLATTEASAQFTVISLPEDFQSQDRLWEKVAQAEEVLRRDAPNRRLTEAIPAGVPYFDLLPDFRAAAQEQSLYYPADHHFNPAGQALAAELIATFLTAEGLVPTS